MHHNHKQWWMIGMVVLALVLIGIGILCQQQHHPKPEPMPYEPMEQQTDTFAYVDTFEAYQSYLKQYPNGVMHDEKELTAADFNGQGYLLYTSLTDLCREDATLDHTTYESGIYHLYFKVSLRCGICALTPVTYIIPTTEADILDVKIYAQTVNREECPENVVYKPILYVYPIQDIDLTIRLGRPDLLLHTYPKYIDGWHIHVSEDGTIYEYQTDRHYYGLYWEAVDYTDMNRNEGFVVKGEDTVTFLEEKLALLGLNERESNEFIIYWIDKLEANPYNWIRFRTSEEINDYMPLSFSTQPDTLIRVIMDVTPLNHPKTVEPQHLTSMKRHGFTVVEWGGMIHSAQD